MSGIIDTIVLHVLVILYVHDIVQFTMSCTCNKFLKLIIIAIGI